jgi:hypothetical protein
MVGGGAIVFQRIICSLAKVAVGRGHCPLVNACVVELTCNLSANSKKSVPTSSL